MKRLLIIFIFCFGLSAAKGQVDECSVHYTQYSKEGKTVKDTFANIKNQYWDDWVRIVIGKDTIKIGGLEKGEHCNCRLFVYQKQKLIEEVFDPYENDTTSFEMNIYTYDKNEQLIEKNSKGTNSTRTTTQYDYDENGRLKNENIADIRFGNAHTQYIYQGEKLIMKIVQNDNHSDTLRIK